MKTDLSKDIKGKKIINYTENLTEIDGLPISVDRLHGKN